MDELTAKKLRFGNPPNGSIELTLSRAGHELRANFYPPSAAGKPLTPEIISECLKKIHVVFGVKPELIQSSLLECNRNKQPVMNVLIASGILPVNEAAEGYERNPDLDTTDDTEDSFGNGAFLPFIIVSKDQALAILKPQTSGKDGRNIFGVVVPYSVIHREGVTGGDNTRVADGKILSNIDGQLIETKNEMKVSNTLVIKGPVGYKVGQIKFPGDIQMDGPVMDGFKIFSGGSLTIKQTFNVTEAVIKGDLTVNGGIIGRGTGLLKVNGGINTKFILNCNAAARKAIYVDKEIINSKVYSFDRVDLGDKGLILGSDIYAIKGITAGGIDKKAGNSSHIHCGIDFAAQQEIEKSNSQMRLIAAKILKIKYMMEDTNTPKESLIKMEEAMRRLEQEKAKISTHISEILGRLNTEDGAVVKVSGEVNRGTLIEICQVALFIDEPLRRVRIKLDKSKNKLVTESL